MSDSHPPETQPSESHAEQAPGASPETSGSSTEAPSVQSAAEETMTLDPPGRIAVVGAGLLGVEAALYGRFLGYDVTLLESEAVGGCLREKGDEPIPVMPDRCASPLALGALRAQRSAGGGEAEASLPTTMDQWCKEVAVALTETDLLRGRLRVPFHVSSIEPLPPEPDEDDSDQDNDSIPHDFRLVGSDSAQEPQHVEAEAVILATGPESDVELGFDLPADYFFRVGDQLSGDWEADLRNGHRQIVAIFAQLAGRSNLDLYRPRRV